MANGFVHVACRLPQGLRLRIFEQHEIDEPTPTGLRKAKISRPVLKNGTEEILEYVVPGYNPGLNKLPANYIVVPGFRTVRVPADFWAKWLEQNKDAAIVQKRIVFAASTEPDVQAMIKEAESANVRSGLEPLAEKNDPRIPSGRFAVTAADEMVR